MRLSNKFYNWLLHLVGRFIWILWRILKAGVNKSREQVRFRRLNFICWCQTSVGSQRGIFVSIFYIHMSVHHNIITNYSQQDATFLEFIYYYRRSTCFRRFLRTSSGANNCTYSFRYCQTILLLAATVEEMELPCAPNDGRRNRLKHVERL
jgi:hypothetical protein